MLMSCNHKDMFSRQSSQMSICVYFSQKALKYIKYITHTVKPRNKTRPYVVGLEFSFYFLEMFVQSPVDECNHIHLLFLTQIIPQSPSHKHFLFPRQSPSVEQVLPQNLTLFVLGQPLEPMKTRKSIKTKL